MSDDQPTSSTLDPTRAGLAALGAALPLGMLGDGLLRAWPWGANVPLCAGAFVLALLGVARWQRLPLAGDGRWLLAPALLFAATFAWRDSLFLKALNGLAFLAAVALALHRLQTGRVFVASIADYFLAALSAAVHACMGTALLLFSDVRWAGLAGGGAARHWLAAGRGLLLALPALVVFTALFSAADASFEAAVRQVFRWSFEELLGHLILTGFLAWLVGGLLREALLTTPWAPPQARLGDVVSLGIVEVAVVLGLIDLLFGAFVALQLPYLFGGAATVLGSDALTYAEYARRGFFELVVVVALAVPLLLLAHALLRRERPVGERAYRILAGLLVVLLVVIMASAVLRMRLYQEAYGQTELRVYATAFMGWLGLVLLWFALTALRGRADRFPLGTVVAAFLVIAALDALGPDAHIVVTNAGQASPAQPLDVRYVSQLSGDAVPALVDALPSLPPDQRRAVARQLLSRWTPPQDQDWRAWSWGRYQAWLAVGGNQNSLEAAADQSR